VTVFGFTCRLHSRSRSFAVITVLHRVLRYAQKLARQQLVGGKCGEVMKRSSRVNAERYSAFFRVTRLNVSMISLGEMISPITGKDWPAFLPGLSNISRTAGPVAVLREWRPRAPPRSACRQSSPRETQCQSPPEHSAGRTRVRAYTPQPIRHGTDRPANVRLAQTQIRADIRELPELRTIPHDPDLQLRRSVSTARAGSLLMSSRTMTRGVGLRLSPSEGRRHHRECGNGRCAGQTWWPRISDHRRKP
jgi:hypothetical protein